MIFKKIKEVRFFLFKSDFLDFLEILISCQGLLNHKLRGRHASAISGYTLAEQKVSK